MSAPAPTEGKPVESPVTVIAAHGLGLGPWVFDPWKEFFSERGLELRALRLPGHTPGEAAGFADVVAAIEAEIDAISGPVALVGHSFSGLAVQAVLARRSVHAAVLICPLPPRSIHVPVPRAALPHLPRLLATVLSGRAYIPSPKGYSDLGFTRLEGSALAEAVSRCVPWPNRLLRDLAIRPDVDASAVATPILVALGGRDPLAPPAVIRVLGDLYEAVVWRYDDLAHTPMLEPGGGRMGRDIARFCAESFRPQVLESEGFGPEEGIGHELRRARRGASMKKRSAYGQKRAAR